MVEEKTVPPGWKTIQYDVERVQKDCDFEKTLLKLWKSHAAAAEEAHIPILHAVALKGVKDLEHMLGKCKVETAELKKKIPSMIREWEEYWKRPFPLTELKRKVEEW